MNIKYTAIILIVVAIAMSTQYYLSHRPAYTFKAQTESEVFRVCSNLTLKQSVTCVTAFETTVYKFKSTPDDINLTFDELKSLGGDCKSWSDWEQKIYTQLGFFSGTIIFPMEDLNTNVTPIPAHEIAYAISKDEMCYIDNLNTWCGYKKPQLNNSIVN